MNFISKKIIHFKHEKNGYFKIKFGGFPKLFTQIIKGVLKIEHMELTDSIFYTLIRLWNLTFDAYFSILKLKKKTKNGSDATSERPQILNRVRRI